jgi:hypothetical protein
MVLTITLSQWQTHQLNNNLIARLAALRGGFFCFVLLLGAIKIAAPTGFYRTRFARSIHIPIGKAQAKQRSYRRVASCSQA